MKLYFHRKLILLGILLLAVAGSLALNDSKSDNNQQELCIAKHSAFDVHLPMPLILSKKVAATSSKS